ncbi:MAG: aminotransferase class I/II-fold pyridoxal phosphate-dependent enzyme, partial [Granulosicoccus sp.]
MTSDKAFHSVNAHISDLPSYNAGLSAESVKRKFNLSRVVKLNSNENPYGPSPRVREVAERVFSDVNQYPDAPCTELLMLLARQLDVDAHQIILGNGSEELIVIAARALLNESDEMVTVSPDFGLHTIHALAMGAKVTQIPFKSDFSFDVDGIVEALQRRPKLLCISSPSNPVGTFLSRSDLERIIAACQKHTLLLFDEAYSEYAALEPDYPDCLSLLNDSSIAYLMLRTFSKAYGLAGLRIGYGIAGD